LIGILIFRSGANREGWHRIEEEVEAVIVIDEDCDVGLLLLHPFPDGLISLEEGLPIGIRMQLPLDRIADRRDVGTADAGDSSCHVICCLRRAAWRGILAASCLPAARRYPAC